MSPIVFTNPKTAELYEALTEYDHRLEIPAEAGCGCQNYAGLLSNLTPCAAERYLKYKGNLIRKKEIVAPIDSPAPPPAQETDGEKKSEEEEQ